MNLSEQYLTELQEKYPTKNVRSEYESAKDFLEYTTKKYKDTEAGWKAFMRNWLRRAKDTRIPPKRIIPPTERYKVELELSDEQRSKNLEKFEKLKSKLLKELND